MAAREGGIPHYAVERGLFHGGQHTTCCPVCGKRGAWRGETFVPARERDAPRCYCATIHAAGGYAYDPRARRVLVRAGVPSREREDTGAGDA